VDLDLAAALSRRAQLAQQDVADVPAADLPVALADGVRLGVQFLAEQRQPGPGTRLEQAFAGDAEHAAGASGVVHRAHHARLGRGLVVLDEQQFHRQTDHLAYELAHVRRRDVVEVQPGHTLHEGVEGDAGGLFRGVLLEHRGLGGGEDAVQAPQHVEGQDDPAVLAPLEIAAQEIGDRPDEGGEGLLVHGREFRRAAAGCPDRNGPSPSRVAAMLARTVGAAAD